jgi:hypothetical protein
MKKVLKVCVVNLFDIAAHHLFSAMNCEIVKFCNQRIQFVRQQSEKN